MSPSRTSSVYDTLILLIDRILTSMLVRRCPRQARRRHTRSLQTRSSFRAMSNDLPCLHAQNIHNNCFLCLQAVAHDLHEHAEEVLTFPSIPSYNTFIYSHKQAEWLWVHQCGVASSQPKRARDTSSSMLLYFVQSKSIFNLFTQSEDSTIFLVAGYSRYACPYVWVSTGCIST